MSLYALPRFGRPGFSPHDGDDDHEKPTSQKPARLHADGDAAGHCDAGDPAGGLRGGGADLSEARPAGGGGLRRP